jgi:hypothetical protein
MIPIFFLYILPTLLLIYVADLPWDEKVVIMASRLVANLVGGIGAALAEAFIKTGERIA